ncbi:amino acid/amide ABC transporter membrane protein 2, HAAT family [Tardiphaga sp. OK246]|uniref:branched-chain amino acid ABC transporter permease n=1 Tax=Tardiphaga sp. OK246 TaxID=1855307 RepID=UPI000B682952|nr:branched-chain amino acid ABC transporter permease [Tardiphaga sp. OK246]SNT31825.1 amino acid/amide ABC transporter membrane protein 2, HAAT family [Tardiphaga sp. OK246]
MMTKKDTIATVLRERRFKVWELTPWLAAGAVWLLLPSYLPFATQIVIMVLLTMSYDIVVGYTGIVILGHTAFYGAGAYAAGLLAVAGWTDPLLGLLIATIVAGVIGAVAGIVILRTSGLPLVVLGMALTLLMGEVMNRFSSITGGADGLQGIVSSPILGAFSFDLYGRVAFAYSIAVLFIAWLFLREMLGAPFGRSLIGIRQNPTRMEALGVSVRNRKLAAFTISAAIAGLAGGLTAQTSQFVSLNVFGLELAGAILLILVIGGRGRLYGAFIGAPAYMIVQDMLAKDDPVYWLFWLGLILIVVVLFAPNGLLGLLDQITALLRRRLGAPAAAPVKGATSHAD